MEIIDELTQKVQQAAEELISLKKERQQTLAELDQLRSQLRDYQTTRRDNEKLRRDQDQLRTRLQKLQKKIEKHLLVETTLASQMRGDFNEERPQ